MPDRPPPKCPKCGSTEVKRLSQREQFPNITRQGNEPPSGAIIAYKCVCGMAFTETVKYLPKPPAQG